MSIKGQMHVQEYVYDFDLDGGAQGAISLSAKSDAAPLPICAIVNDVYARVLTAVAGTSSTLAWGNTTDPDGYSGTAIAEASLTADSMHNASGNAGALLWDDTNDHMIPFLVAAADDQDFSVTVGTADLTAGKVVFVVEYYFPKAE